MIISILTSKFETNRFGLILAKYSYRVKLNDILAGRIIGLESTHALVDIGLERAALLPREEINVSAVNNPKAALYIDFIGEFLILSINKTTQQIIVSLKQVDCMRLWQRIRQIDFKNTVIYAINERPLRKGKIILFYGLKFFSLNSHIPKHYRRKKRKNFLLPFKFVEVKDIIHIGYLNSRLAVYPRFSQNLEVGGTYCSNVVSIKSFGIFVNIYGIQCLLHISEISYDRISDINSLYKKGDQLKVKIVYKSIQQGKISVSIKKL
nr:30S ribosomal protein S1 [Ishige okamurae]